MADCSVATPSTAVFVLYVFSPFLKNFKMRLDRILDESYQNRWLELQRAIDWNGIHPIRITVILEQDKGGIVEGLAGGRVIDAQKVCSTWKMKWIVQRLKPAKRKLERLDRKRKQEGSCLRLTGLKNGKQCFSYQDSELPEKFLWVWWCMWVYRKNHDG